MLASNFPSLYAIIDCSSGDFPWAYLEQLLNAKVRLIQLRDKSPTAETRLAAKLPSVLELRQGLAPEAKIIVNDFVELALKFPVDGVHLGQGDCPPAEAREKLGSKRILGLSTHSLNQVLEAPVHALDYIACGPVFASPTKDGHAPELGLSLLRELVTASALPVVAIGGITLDRAALIYGTGASSIALISDLARSEDLSARVEGYRKASGQPL